MHWACSVLLLALDAEVVVITTLVGGQPHIAGVNEPECAAHTLQTMTIFWRRLDTTWGTSAT